MQIWEKSRKKAVQIHQTVASTLFTNSPASDGNAFSTFFHREQEDRAEMKMQISRKKEGMI